MTFPSTPQTAGRLMSSRQSTWIRRRLSPLRQKPTWTSSPLGSSKTQHTRCLPKLRRSKKSEPYTGFLFRAYFMGYSDTLPTQGVSMKYAINVPRNYALCVFLNDGHEIDQGENNPFLLVD